MRVKYAQHADVLYIVFSDPSDKCVYVELDSGIICRINEFNEQVAGITIPDFLRRVQRNETIEIPELAGSLSAARLLEISKGRE